MKGYRLVDHLTQGYLLLVGCLIVLFHNATVPHWAHLSKTEAIRPVWNRSTQRGEWLESLGGRIPKTVLFGKASCRLSASPVAGGYVEKRLMPLRSGGVWRSCFCRERLTLGMHALQHSSVKGTILP